MGNPAAEPFTQRAFAVAAPSVCRRTDRGRQRRLDPIEAGPGGSKVVGVWITDVGDDEPNSDSWAPQHVRWATNDTSYTGEGTVSPRELADKILRTIVTDNGGGPTATI